VGQVDGGERRLGPEGGGKKYIKEKWAGWAKARSGLTRSIFFFFSNFLDFFIDFLNIDFFFVKIGVNSCPSLNVASKMLHSKTEDT